MLNLQNVCYAYKTKFQVVEAVKDVSYSFAPGHVYAVVGKSGSGKTTLLSLMAGLDLPSHGSILYRGEATTDLDRDKYRRQNVSVIYQAYNLFPLLTSLENVMYPLELQRVKGSKARSLAADAIASVGLDQQFHRRFPAMLSGGEQQRIAIARAMVSQPKVVLADEPTGNLDAENATQVINLLVDMARQRNSCVIIVTHDLSIADRADEVLMMKDGRLSQGD